MPHPLYASPMTLHSALIVAAHLALLAVGAWLVVIDTRTHRLPDRIVLPTLVATLVLVTAEALAVQDAARLLRAVAGMVVICGFFVVLRLISRGGMGGGDVKLAALLGVVLGWHGWTAVVLGLFAAFLLASLYALVLMALRKAGPKSRIAFGPWMILGAVLAIAAT